MATLVQAAEASHSDALVVLKDGKLVGEWYFGKPQGPIEAMSVTKSVVSLAIGALMAEGKIKSIDEPLYAFYPEWKQGRKQAVTLRHLLSHTSGLQNYPRTDVEIYPSPDFVQLALAAELTEEPGKAFAYNNKAVNLLAGVVQKAAGQRLDVYLREGLFKKMGITHFDWTLDQAGNPHGMSGLQVRPTDLAKLGQLMLQQGRWNGQQLLTPAWVTASKQASQEVYPAYGLLWWLIPASTTYLIDQEQIGRLEAAGVKPEFVAKVRGLQGNYPDQAAYTLALEKSFGKKYQRVLVEHIGHLDFALSKKKHGPIIGYSGRGDLGQYLVVYPSQGLVAVRMVRGSDAYSEATDGFDDFERQVAQLVKSR
ncbi:MAG TPA: serine hydrolase [Hymenobacter sp.]